MRGLEPKPLRTKKPKIAKSIFPFVNCIFSCYEIWVRGGGSRQGGTTLLLWLSAVQIRPCLQVLETRAKSGHQQGLRPTAPAAAGRDGGSQCRPCPTYCHFSPEQQGAALCSLFWASPCALVDDCPAADPQLLHRRLGDLCGGYTRPSLICPMGTYAGCPGSGGLRPCGYGWSSSGRPPDPIRDATVRPFGSPCRPSALSRQARPAPART